VVLRLARAVSRPDRPRGFGDVWTVAGCV